MAYCEQCGRTGFDPRQMRVDEEKRTFLGPCCTKVVELAPPGVVPPADWDCGIEVSKNTGILAYASYGGMKLEFKRSPAELQAWWEEQHRLQEQSLQRQVG
jgi:hypothetical protein